MKIDAFITPYFLETENQFKDSLVVMIDVLRAGTSICSALHSGAKEVIPVETTEKAVHIYSSLSKETRFLGGERQCEKPSGFDAGNSPSEYGEEAVKDKTVIISTTNGTKLFMKAKQSKQKIIGAFVNMDAVTAHIYGEIEKEPSDVAFLCAGTDGRLSYEDTLCAGAFISELKKRYKDAEMSDTAHAAKSLYNLFSVELEKFIMQREHSRRLIELGYTKDIETALEKNKYPVVPVLSGSSIKNEQK